METCVLNDLLPDDIKVKKITTGSELLLAYELDKYARLLLDKKLSLKGTTILKQLYTQAEFSFVVSHDLDIGFEVINKKGTLMDISTKEGYFFTDTVQGVRFKEQTDKEWVFEFGFDTHANVICHGMNRSAAYVSLVAYMIIDSISRGVTCPKLIIDHSTYAELSMEYMDLIILQNYGSRILKDLVEIRFNTQLGNQPEVEAFTMMNRQRGYMNREYTANEKFRYLKKNFEVGDIVLLYTRKKASKTKSVRYVDSCYPAIITNFNNSRVSLTYFPNINTKITHSMLLSSAEEEYAEVARTKGLISDEDYTRFTVCPVTFDLLDIGTDIYTYLEDKFFIRPVEFDGSYQYFKTQQGYERVFLDTLDTIYALFEDRNLWYDDEAKERFVIKYFKARHKEPVYEQYRQWLNS